MDRTPETRRATAEIAACAHRRLTQYQINELRKDRNAGVEYRELAKKYRISLGTAYNLGRG